MALRTEKKLQKSYFDVLGICCTSEVPLVENILKSLDGIKEYSVIVPSRTVIVVHDTLLLSQYQIVKALNQARLEANVRITGESNFKNKWPNPFTVVSGVLLLVSFVHYVFPPFRWLAVAAVVAGIYPIIAKSFASLRMFRIDINILVVITVIATLAMRDYTEAAAVVFLFTIAEWLQTRASYKASAVMQSLMSLAPQKATIAETGEEVEVDELKINTIIAVKAGEIIPIDGIVVDGNCEIDEKTLTGEPFPVPKHRDSTVWAGTINLNGYISVKTIALAEDCAVAKMAKLVEEAQNRKTNTQRFIDKCSQYYTPAIILISAGFAIIPLALKVDNLRHWFHLALVVLVSACPCGLILSTPVATCCALSKAATSQLLIKGADYLETLAKLKIIAFDKTGTITRGEFIVIDFKSISQDLALETLLYWVSSAESKSSHPMAAALVDYARSMAIEPNPEVVEDYMNFPGEGISGKIDGKEIYIGNKRIALRAGCSSVPDIDVDTRGGKTVGYVYTEARLVGVFNLSDACRSGVAQAMKELKSLGLKTVMLTGDNQAAAMYAQEQLGNGLDVVKAELLPEGKSKLIEEFKKEGLTGMVGDGLNDAPALATANIGISMGVSGSALVTETGDIILMSNDIRRIPQAIELARRTQDKVIENVILSITMKGGILALAIAGHPLIWAAVLADVGTCLLVIFNSMLLLRDKNKPGNKCYRDVKKLKLEDNVVDDMEAGLLPKRFDGHCKSSCCGHKNQEKVIKLVEIRTEPGHHGHGHGHSGCCDKKHDHKVKPVRENCCPEHDGLGQYKNLQTLLLEDNVELIQRCCGKTSHERVIKLAETKTDSDHSHHSGCCQKKHEDKSRLVRRSCCPIPVVSRHCRNFENYLLEEKVELLPKSSAGHSGSGCCGKKSHEKVIKPAESRLVSDHSHSGCCDKKHEDKFKLERQSCGPKSVDQGVTETQLLLKSSDGHGGSGCCGKKKQEEVIKLTDTDHDHCGQEDKVRLVRQSCCPKPVDLGHSDMGCCDDKAQHIITCCEKPDGLVRSQEKMKSISDCRSGHCLEEHQPLKNLETQTQKAKTDEHCKAPCCDDNKNKEIVNEYSCDLESEGSCKSHCCSCEEEEVTETTNLISQAETEDLDCCNSGCCHNEDEEDQSSHDKPDNSDQEISRSNQSSKLYRSASTPLETLTRLL